MDWEFIVGIIAVLVLLIAFVVLARRNMNHNYTIGSGMFKMSDDNLEKDKHLDISDYDYYNKDGNLR